MSAADTPAFLACEVQGEDCDLPGRAGVEQAATG